MREVVYYAEKAMVVGQDVGSGQLLNGTRVTIIENSSGIFVGDSSHVRDIKSLQCQTVPIKASG